MILNELFKIQAELDEHIVKEKGLQGQDLLDKKILALQVELGELANEWKGFKFWKIDPQPRTKVEHLCPVCNAKGTITDEFESNRCEDCKGTGKLNESNPLLEEYVDCLHFILSIGLDIELTPDTHVKWRRFTIVEQFNDLFGYASGLFESIDEECGEDFQFNVYEELLYGFLGLGDMIGFTWEQIENAYLDKNKINHARQVNGY